MAAVAVNDDNDVPRLHVRKRLRIPPLRRALLPANEDSPSAATFKGVWMLEPDLDSVSRAIPGWFKSLTSETEREGSSADSSGTALASALKALAPTSDSVGVHPDGVGFERCVDNEGSPGPSAEEESGEGGGGVRWGRCHSRVGSRRYETRSREWVEVTTCAVGQRRSDDDKIRLAFEVTRDEAEHFGVLLIANFAGVVGKGACLFDLALDGKRLCEDCGDARGLAHCVWETSGHGGAVTMLWVVPANTLAPGTHMLSPMWRCVNNPHVADNPANTDAWVVIPNAMHAVHAVSIGYCPAAFSRVKRKCKSSSQRWVPMVGWRTSNALPNSRADIFAALRRKSARTLYARETECQILHPRGK